MVKKPVSSIPWAPSSRLLHCLSFCPDFLQWWTLWCKGKPNKPFLPKVALVMMFHSCKWNSKTCNKTKTITLKLGKTNQQKKRDQSKAEESETQSFIHSWISWKHYAGCHNIETEYVAQAHAGPVHPASVSVSSYECCSNCLTQLCFHVLNFLLLLHSFFFCRVLWALEGGVWWRHLI